MRNDSIPVNPAREGRRSGGKRRLVLMVYAIWVACVLLASAGYLAETATRKAAGYGEYTYHPVFEEDGTIKHYTVQRADQGEDAEIDISYRDSTRVVEVTSTNVMILTVDCRSIAEDKHEELLGVPYEDDQDYLDYFRDLEFITVNANTDGDMTITWEHMPEPVLVTEDGVEQEFRVLDDSIETEVPSGEHTVVIYFAVTASFPTAEFTMDHDVTGVGSPVTFDSSPSTATGGKTIDRREWTFGDESDPEIGSDIEVSHSFSAPGEYDVTLTVRDSEGLKSTVSHQVTVMRDLPDDLDLDGDGDPDWSDDDIDGDGAKNIDDEFIRDPTESVDTDKDGVGDNADWAPMDPDETDDTDGDGVGDNADPEPMNADINGLEKEGGDDEDNSMLLIVAVLLIVIIMVVVIMVVIRAKGKRSEETAVGIQPVAPAPGPARPGSDLGFTPPVTTPAPAPAPMPAMETVETLEPVEEVSVLDAAPPRGGPYDTSGMGRDEYLDSLDGILRDEFPFNDEEVDTIVSILEDELTGEVS